MKSYWKIKAQEKNKSQYWLYGKAKMGVERDAIKLDQGER